MNKNRSARITLPQSLPGIFCQRIGMTRKMPRKDPVKMKLLNSYHVADTFVGENVL